MEQVSVKVGIVGADVTECGRELQARAAATGNARSQVLNLLFMCSAIHSCSVWTSRLWKSSGT